MAKQIAKLKSIENDHEITKDSDSEFLFALQNALLLALQEQGQLTPIQYRHAVEGLKKQRQQQAGK